MCTFSRLTSTNICDSFTEFSSQAIQSLAMVDPDIYGTIYGISCMEVGAHSVIRSRLLDSNIVPSFFTRNTQKVNFQKVNKGLATLRAIMFVSGWEIASVSLSSFLQKSLLMRKNNICEIQENICLGHLNIPRKSMPQLKGDVLTSFLNDKKVKEVNFNARDLTPIQNEGDWRNVQSMVRNARNGVWDPCNSTHILTTGNLYDPFIVDGHHRAFSSKLLGRSIKALHMVDISPEEALMKANSFPGVKHHDSGYFER